jgi:phosphoglucomutase
MTTILSPLAGMLPPASMLLDVAALLAAYFEQRPDPRIEGQRVVFGTSGHRGSAFDASFNEWHVLAISQAVCDYRRHAGITGPMHVGIDTHALSQPAFETTLEVLAANGVTTRIAPRREFTPTPAISHAILAYNRKHRARPGDGIVITPSHNPPESGGIKYNGTHGGPAGTDATGWIQDRANLLLEAALIDVRRVPYSQARRADTTHRFDFLDAYVADLGSVIDFDAIRGGNLRIGVDPLGGAGVHYWQRIAEEYRIDLDVTSTHVDPTFAFMSVDHDGRIRMDPSSPHAMQSLLALKDRYDIAFACDADHDRHGIVSAGAGLLPANHYLTVMVDYLFRHRGAWRQSAGVGKTVVSTALLDRVAARLGRRLVEVPVGFKWYVDGLLDGSLAFAGEESAGASFGRRDGRVWTTDKDGITAGLLAAEITARTGRDPARLYEQLSEQLGATWYERIDVPATVGQRMQLQQLSATRIQAGELAGERIVSVIDRAPGNGGALGGVKVESAGGWFALRPSGTENAYKIYAESFRDRTHLAAIQADAQRIVETALAPP